jgi:hypothetical protein
MIWERTRLACWRLRPRDRELLISGELRDCSPHLDFLTPISVYLRVD